MRERLSRPSRREAVPSPMQLGGGRPLSSEEREAVGPRTDGFRLENIRIHAGDGAAALANARGAEAMAQGAHVLLPDASPATSHGRALIRHEVTHALQHQAGLTSAQSVDTLEAQASAAERDTMPSFSSITAPPPAPPILHKDRKRAKKKGPSAEDLAVTHQGGVEGVDTALIDDLVFRISLVIAPRLIQKGKRKKVVPTLLVLRSEWKLAAELIQNPKTLRGAVPKRFTSLASLFDVDLAEQLEALTDEERVAVAAEVERQVVGLKQDASVDDLTDEFSQLHANLKNNLSGGFLGWVAMREGLLRAFKDVAGINDYYSQLVAADFPSGKVKGHGTLVHANMKSRLDRARGIIEKNPGWMEIVEKSLGTRGLWATQVRENTANPVDVGTHAFGWAVDIEPSLNPDIRPFPAIFKDVTGDDAGAGPSVVAMRNKNISLADAVTHSGKLRDMSDRLVAAFKDKESILKAISAYLKREGAGDLSDAERSSLGGLLELAAQAKDKKSQATAIRSVETFVLARFDKERSARAAPNVIGASSQSTAMEDSIWVTEMTRDLGGLSSSPGDLDRRWAVVEKQIDSPDTKAPPDAKKLGLSPIFSKASVKTLKALTPVSRLQTKQTLRQNLELRMHRVQATRTSGKAIDILKLFLQAEKERPKGPVDRPTAAGVAAHGFQSLPPQLVGPLVAQEGAGLQWLGVMLGEKDTMHFELRPGDQPTLPGGKYPNFLRGPGEKGPKPAPDVVPEGDPVA